MAKVTGIGGVFVKAKDPAALGAFYRDALGAPVQGWGGAQFVARDAETGETVSTVWNPFPEGTGYFEPSDRPFMLNLRVDDLDEMLASLRARGARVLDRRESTAEGTFGYVVDPEGTLIELWEPASDDPSPA